jgi:hypothetical protein
MLTFLFQVELAKSESSDPELIPVDVSVANLEGAGHINAKNEVKIILFFNHY